VTDVEDNVVNAVRLMALAADIKNHAAMALQGENIVDFVGLVVNMHEMQQRAAQYLVLLWDSTAAAASGTGLPAAIIDALEKMCMANTKMTATLTPALQAKLAAAEKVTTEAKSPLKFYASFIVDMRSQCEEFIDHHLSECEALYRSALADQLTHGRKLFDQTFKEYALAKAADRDQKRIEDSILSQVHHVKDIPKVAASILALSEQINALPFWGRHKLFGEGAALRMEVDNANLYQELQKEYLAVANALHMRLVRCKNIKGVGLKKAYAGFMQNIKSTNSVKLVPQHLLDEIQSFV
jgi:hypothetical protein